MDTPARQGEETRLRVLTFDAQAQQASADLVAEAQSCTCTGGYSGDCMWCIADRVRRVRAGIRKPRQPWQPRPSRERIAA